jgi:FMN reductase
MTRIVGVLGSVTPPGRLLRALAWALEAAREHSAAVEAELINLADVRLGFADGQPPDQLDDDTATVVGTLDRADAVIFASPVYRASFTGALKNLLDLTPIDALRGKACGIIAMGASQHHYLGVDWHLRDVLAWFGAVPLPSSVYLSSADFAEGELAEAARAELGELVQSLTRLAQALRVAGPLGPTPLAGRRR